MTHLFNAMGGLHHRTLGLPGLTLSANRVRVGPIADGVHVDPAMVGIVARAVGDRLSLVTDWVAALVPGAVGDLVALDAEERVVATVIGGRRWVSPAAAP